VVNSDSGYASASSNKANQDYSSLFSSAMKEEEDFGVEDEEDEEDEGISYFTR
jgi:hypothetical protein